MSHNEEVPMPDHMIAAVALDDRKRERDAQEAEWATGKKGRDEALLEERMDAIQFDKAVVKAGETIDRRARISELTKTIEMIQSLTLPEHYSAEERHRDAVMRAGVCTAIKGRIEELQGKAPSGPKDAAEQFVATGRTIEGRRSAALPVQDRKIAGVHVENGPVFKCDARAGWGDPAGTPADCDWPVCGCDPYADKVIAALQESNLLRPYTRPAR